MKCRHRKCSFALSTKIRNKP